MYAALLSFHHKSHGGRNDVTTHFKGKQHKEMAMASSSSRSITSMFNPKVSESAIKAEALWAIFIIIIFYLFLFFSKLASRIATSVGKPKSVVLHDLYGRLNMHIVRANATAILSRCMPFEFP